MGCPWGQRAQKEDCTRESPRAQVRWENGPPVCHRVWGWADSLVGAYLLPTQEALWSGEWGPLAPKTRPAWPPASPALAA